jgi:hypothetical protein
MFEFPDKPEEAEQLSLRLHVDMVRQEAMKGEVIVNTPEQPVREGREHLPTKG